MSADPRIYDSERLARYYSQSRPPIHEVICAKLVNMLPVGFEVRAALDIGCGAGASSAVLVPHAASVIGIDPYRPMLLRARRRVPTASFIQATAVDLPAGMASIDLVTAAGSLNYTDIERSLAEAARVLSPTGFLAAYDFSTGRVLPRNAPTEARFSSFERTFPWPAGYSLDLERLPYAAHGLSLVYFETFVVEISMSEDDYLEYVLGETNVEVAVSRGLPELDARQSSWQIFRPLFEGGSRMVGFSCVLAVAMKSINSHAITWQQT